ncbi:metalloregulator ArsR/SmtB family transcription factor [Actinomadura vinacea]|uniref:Metalloregulator ArsR/SmtB family transcription factor n=1 Tax=Actinomadura vinacea TaxID=115336 RepID=A0ABN3JSL7_9ACTN
MDAAVAVDADALERVGVALADGTRRRLLLALLEGPAFPAELADRLELTRGNVSNHLACLRGCGLVSAAPVGRRVRYQMADPRLAHALADLASLVLVITHPDATVCADQDDCCPPAEPTTAQISTAETPTAQAGSGTRRSGARP